MNCSFIFLSASTVWTWSDWTWLLFFSFSRSLLYFVHFFALFAFRFGTTRTWWRRGWWRFCEWHWHWL